MNIAFFGDSLIKGNHGISFIKLITNKLPKYFKVYNYGKNADTVISNYRRITELRRVKQHYDISVLWIGTNDVFSRKNLTHIKLKDKFGQPISKNVKEFQKYYMKTIKFLKERSDKIITILIIPLEERTTNPWRKDIDLINGVIKKISEKEKFECVNLNDEFRRIKTDSAYAPNSARQVIIDHLYTKKKENVEKLAKERGFVYTFDGVHLTKKGADLVAKKILEKILEKTE